MEDNTPKTNPSPQNKQIIDHNEIQISDKIQIQEPEYKTVFLCGNLLEKKFYIVGLILGNATASGYNIIATCMFYFKTVVFL